MDGFLLIDKARGGSENMAFDGAMLELAAQLRKPILRVYQWAEPTVSLGYFQTVSDYEAHSCSEAPAVVRRATGGGAIVHDHDWTYSIAVPDKALVQRPAASQPTTEDTAEDASASSNSSGALCCGGTTGAPAVAIGPSQVLYNTLHDAVVAWLAAADVEASKYRDEPAGQLDGAKPSESKRSKEPFLCFLRRSEGDVICSRRDVSTALPQKIMGSAQRRGRGAVLQHGSLLLAQSRFANELPGVAELTGVSFDDEDRTAFAKYLATSIEQTHGLVLSEVNPEDQAPLLPPANHAASQPPENLVTSLAGGDVGPDWSWEEALVEHADRRFYSEEWTRKR